MKLIIPAELERKLDAYVQAVNAEIAGMGEIELRDDGNIWVTDIAIYTQNVTSGTADLSPQALAAFQTELIKSGRSPKKWNLWWHSHNDFAAFFSGTDTGTIAASTEYDSIVSLVVNKKGERKCRIDYHRPWPMFMDNVLVQVAPEINEHTLAIEEDIFQIGKQIGELNSRVVELRKMQDTAGFDTPDVKAEVEEKVTIKNLQNSPKYKPWEPKKPAGFGDNKDFELPFRDNWSKKRKKGGTVTIIGSENETIKLDRDEIELVIEDTQKLIRANVGNGNGNSAECEELRVQWRKYLNYLNELDDAEMAEYGLFWDGENWTDAEGNVKHQVIEYEDDGLDYGDDLPPLPNGYHYTLATEKESK